jgi:hypothetical protein
MERSADGTKSNNGIGHLYRASMGFSLSFWERSSSMVRLILRRNVRIKGCFDSGQRLCVSIYAKKRGGVPRPPKPEPRFHSAFLSPDTVRP